MDDEEDWENKDTEDDDGDQWWTNKTNETNATDSQSTNKTAASKMPLLPRRKLSTSLKPQLKQRKDLKQQDNFRDYVLQMASHYKTPHILMLVGSNVNMRDAELYYQQLD